MKEKPQVFLLHFAGGNKYSYEFLRTDMVQFFEFLPLELPGRGERMNEKLITDLHIALDDYLDQIVQKFKRGIACPSFFMVIVWVPS